MSNLPGANYTIPGIYGIPEDYIYTDNYTTIIIKYSGDIIVVGSLKMAALLLYKGIIEKITQSRKGYLVRLHKIIVNTNTLDISFAADETTDIKYIKSFNELKPYYDEVKKLKVFL